MSNFIDMVESKVFYVIMLDIIVGGKSLIRMYNF